MNKRPIAYLLIVTLIFSYCFFVFDVNFRGPDEPIYFSYTASVIEDGDLNAVNQFNADSGIYVSQTYNLPDFHNHGGVILWAPIYAYGKLFGSDKFTKCALSLSTVVFGLLTLLLTFLFCRKFFSEKLSLWSTLLMFLATPYFYFTFFEPGNGQIIASLLSTLSIFILYYAGAMKRIHWFFYGIFFSVCVAVKLDLWFQGFLIATYYTVLCSRKELPIRYGLYFVFGFILFFTLNLVNDYIKYGVIHKGEFYLFNPHNFYFFDQLFSSYRGYFYTSPIFYIALLGFILAAFAYFKRGIAGAPDRRKLTMLLMLGMYLFIKIFIISYRYAWGGGTTGARHLLTELPVFVLLYAYAVADKKRLIRYLFYFLSIIAMLWNLLVISEFVKGVDVQYLTQAPELGVRLKSLGAIFNLLAQGKELVTKWNVFLPLFIFACLFIIIAARERVRITAQEQAFRALSFFAVYAFLAYLIITFFNIYNNKRNAQALRAEGFFKNAVVVSSRDYERQENVASMDEMIVYFGLKNNLAMVEKIKRLKRDIYGD